MSPAATAATAHHHDEYTQADVDYLVRELARLSKKRVQKDYPNPEATPRDAHAKCIGLLKGTLQVEPNLPPELAVGIFAPSNAADGGDWPCYVRLSNALGSPSTSDTGKDLRGLAIKILDKQHERNTVQDFILVNQETISLGTPWMFLSLLYWASISPVLVPVVFAAKLQLRALLRALGTVTPTLADQSYFSTTPMAWGAAAPVALGAAEEADGVLAVKYMLRPSPANGKGPVLNKIKGNNYLREELAAHLEARKELSWDFCIQRRATGPARKKQAPLNDISIPWKTEFVKLGTLRVEDQVFSTDDRAALAENLSFNLNHHLPEHQPIGIMNRVRMELYEQMSKFRHERTGKPDPEGVPATGTAAGTTGGTATTSTVTTSMATAAQQQQQQPKVEEVPKLPSPLLTADDVKVT